MRKNKVHCIIVFIQSLTVNLLPILQKPSRLAFINIFSDKGKHSWKHMVKMILTNVLKKLKFFSRPIIYVNFPLICKKRK